VNALDVERLQVGLDQPAQRVDQGLLPGLIVAD
jgi:hypothetical protein